MRASKKTSVVWCLLTLAGMHPALAPRAAGAEPEPVPETLTGAVIVDDEPRLATEESVPAVSVGFIPPDEIQCRAARASAAGNLLAAERAAVETPRHARGGAAHAACVRRSMLALAAEEARNRDAGTALLLYWSLAEALHSRPALGAAIESADRALADHATVAARGLELPVDRSSLVTRRLAIDDNRITLDTAVATLTESLQLAADLPHVGIDTARPGQDESLLDQPLNADALVAEAMGTRPELRMLRMLQANLDADTAPVARTALATISPALGQGDAAKPCGLVFGRFCNRGESDLEVQTIARQLRQWRQFREAAVADEVRRATHECVGHAERAQTARARLEASEQALADLKTKQPVDGSDAFSIRVAELDVAAARRAVVERLAAWERSRVTLWQAQGILARPCGHGGH